MSGLLGLMLLLTQYWTCQVKFQPPRVTLGKLINLPIGPKSSVILTTTYLTPTVRLGKGSRGSLFVFTKGGDADRESEHQQLVIEPAFSRKALPCAASHLKED